MSVGDRHLRQLSERFPEARVIAPGERRDPTAATQQLRYLGARQPQVADLNAERAVKTYAQQVTAWRCINIIADTIAGLRFRAGTRLPDHPSEAPDHRPDAPMARLLGQGGAPNPSTPAASFWKWTLIQRLATGRQAWEIETDDTRAVAALWPLVAANLDAIPAEGGTEWFASFRYGRPDRKVRLDRDSVFYAWDAAPTDFRQADSPLSAARYPLSIAVQSDRFNLGFLTNGGVPAHVVVVERFESAEQLEAFERQWNDSYSGADKAGKVHVQEVELSDDGTVEGAFRIEAIGSSMKDARFVEQHEAAMKQVAIALGVPWSRLDASGRTFDNAAQEDRAWWTDTILPLVGKLGDEINLRLAPRLGAEVGWFDLSQIEALRPTPPVDAQGAFYLVRAGIVSPAEVRPWYGLAAEDVPVPEPEKSTEPAEEPPPPEIPERAGREHEERQLQPAERRMTAAEREEHRAGLWRTTDAVLTVHERAWERRFRALFDRQSDSTVTRLEGNRRSKQWQAMSDQRAKGHEVRAQADDLFDPAFWAAQTEATAVELFEALAAAGFGRMAERFGVTFDLEAEFAQQFINARANQLAGQVTDTTYRALKEALAEGVGLGESIPKLADRIRAVFAEASELRATTIARTEVISAFNASGMLAASTLPGDVVAGKQWIATRDGRTRPTHADADGQIVPVAGAFQVGASAGAYPGDPQMAGKETINCRCAIAFLTPEEWAVEVDDFAAVAVGRSVPVSHARAVLGLVRPGEFDERSVRAALEVAA